MRKSIKKGIGYVLTFALIAGVQGNVIGANNNIKGKDGNTYSKSSCAFEFQLDGTGTGDGKKGAPGHKKFQNIEVVGNKVYATVRYNADGDKIKDDLAIMEFSLDTKNKVAKYNNKMMTILDGGHGETLDTYTYNGVRYFVVSVKAIDDSESESEHGDQFASQVAFVRFTPAEKKSYSKYSRISYLNYAGNTKSSRGTVIRTVASVSGDDLNIRVKYKNDKYYYATYNIKNIIKNKVYKSASEDKNASIDARDISSGTYFTKGTDGARSTGHSSFQGMESQGSYIYISSGKGEVPMIGKFNESSLSFKSGYYYDATLKMNGKTVKLSNCETEGLCMDGNKINMLIENDGLYYVISRQKF